MFKDFFTTYSMIEPPQIYKDNPNLEMQDIEESNITNYPMVATADIPASDIQEYPGVISPFNTQAEESSYTRIDLPIINEKSNNKAEQIVNLARSLSDRPYIYGAMDPNKGFDCSGLINYVYKQAGIQLPRTSHGMAKVGKKVSLNEVQPGDIIYTKSSGPSGGHVKMVSSVSNGQISVIEAKGKKWGIQENELTNTSDIITIRRIIDNNTSNNTSDQIINYFISKGLTREQAKGIYGNIMQESGGDASITSNDGSYGLAQWTKSRKDQLFKMYGTNPTLNQQLDFLWWELNNTHKDTLAALKRTKTVYDATKIFMDEFERPNQKYANFNRRLQFANSIT